MVMIYQSITHDDISPSVTYVLIVCSYSKNCMDTLHWKMVYKQVRDHADVMHLTGTAQNRSCTD